MDIPYISKENIQTVFFNDSCKQSCLIGQHFFNSSPSFLNFDTLYDTVSKRIVHKTNNLLLVFQKLQGITLFQAVADS